jgi:hypothetical protein
VKFLQVKLERCNDTFCLPTTPQVVYGLKGSSADMFLDNAEYRKFLFREFGVSTVDEESAAVVMVSFNSLYASYFSFIWLPIFAVHPDHVI